VHVTSEVPGAINEGGYVRNDNPNLIVTRITGDGECETGALVTAWHSFKFIDSKKVVL
jgi:xylulose-5-phosphate/fructose-6-phosphate phosphoketolase